MPRKKWNHFLLMGVWGFSNLEVKNIEPWPWQKQSWLFRVYRGWSQLYGDYFINHYKDPYEPITIQWTVMRVFSCLNLWAIRVLYYTMAVDIFVVEKGVATRWGWFTPTSTDHQRSAIFTKVLFLKQCWFSLQEFSSADFETWEQIDANILLPTNKP